MRSIVFYVLPSSVRIARLKVSYFLSRIVLNLACAGVRGEALLYHGIDLVGNMS